MQSIWEDHTEIEFNDKYQSIIQIDENNDEFKISENKKYNCLNLSITILYYIVIFRLNEIIDVSCSIPEYYNLKADINGDFNFDQKSNISQ